MELARLRRLKLALVHDWLTGLRGGERVLDHLAQRFPDADLFTLFYRPGSTTPTIERLAIRASPLNRVPGSATHYRKLLPLYPWAIAQFDFRGYDLILSTSHAVAKSIATPIGIPHVSYCFTPMRYVWDQADAYLGTGLRRSLTRPLVRSLRRFDVATSDRDHVTRFLAISTEVAGRIDRHFGRDSTVVPPPIDLGWIDTASEPAEDFYLMVGGFVPYKRESLAIETFRRLDRKLVIVGDGPSRRKLERRAPANVEFTGKVDGASLASLYRRTRALIYPQHEDFGLVAVEAQAAGRPVIAFGAGGVLDTVRPLVSSPEQSFPSGSEWSDPSSASGPTGVFFDRPEPDSLAEAIERFEKAERYFDPRALRASAERFSPERFDRSLDKEISIALESVR